MPAQQTTGQYFKELTILHFALVAGVVLFALIAFGLQTSGAFDNNESLETVFSYMVPVLAFFGVVASGVLYKKQVNEIKNKNSLSEKLEAYRGVFILRDALLDGPSIFAVIAYLLTGDLLFLALTGSLIAVMILFRPAKDKLIKDLELSSAEAEIIKDDDGIIG